MFDEDNVTLKKEVGTRFKRFRESIEKTQAQLAKELNVYQSTITNIEMGKTFPGIRYLHYFQDKYRLNINWMLNGRGEILMTDEDLLPKAPSRINCHVPASDSKYKNYLKLMELMRVPLVEQIIMGKVLELEVIAKEEINSYLQRQKEKERQSGQ
jgi:transcriptional regulator with XRE-family HTH domain